MLCCLLVLLSFTALAQMPRPLPNRVAGGWEREAAKASSPLKGLPFRSIGPSIMGGRVTDLAVNPQNPHHFYVAFASGGLWVTHNNGQHFEPLFDEVPSMSIGDIAVDWREQPEVIWVGTGENNSSRSSYSGTGLYCSRDLGKTWSYKGLAATHHIGRIRLHPKDKNTLWVAALGHLYSQNPERGLYKSNDAGATWTQCLALNDSCGAIDLIVHSQHPDTLLVATWERQRWPWHFKGQGASSGLHRSFDGGKSWTRLEAQTGFPQGKRIGRIGLDACWKGEQWHIYAVVDNHQLQQNIETSPLSPDSLAQMSASDFGRIPQKELEAFLKKHHFPELYSAEKLKASIAEGQLRPKDLLPFIRDASAALFNTKIKGAELYYSSDLGENWQRCHNKPLEGIYFSYGYYFGQVRVHPQNPKRVYLLGVPLLCSTDGGKNFRAIGKPQVHVDHHALWLHPEQEGYLLSGNDGGLILSYDDGQNWQRCQLPAVGQFYSVAVDNAQPYQVYGGLQDNGVWKGPSTYVGNNDWRLDGRYPYQRLMGGDGMQIALDSLSGNSILGFQFGNYFRLEPGKKPKKIQPKVAFGTGALRFNWETPILLSPQQPNVLYLGAQYLYRSFRQGDNWQRISEDLAPSSKVGNVPYGSLSCISESPRRMGLLYVGSDNGFLHRSKDAGATWERLPFPENAPLWVSDIKASQHQTGRVYLSLNGYRADDFRACLYYSDDFGDTWTEIGQSLPDEPINVLLESPFNERVLFVGTDNGLYVKTGALPRFSDAGNRFHPLPLPPVAVHDLAVQKREKELVVATHGRSLYAAPLNALHEMQSLDSNQKVHIFSIKKLKWSSDWGKSWSPWLPAPQPQLSIPYYTAPGGKSQWKLRSETGFLLKSWHSEQERGLNYLEYDLRISETSARAWSKKRKQPLRAAADGAYYLPVGKYLLELEHAGERHSRFFEITAP